MNYEKAYKEALERAKDLHDNHPLGQPQTWITCERIFPILKESDDEKIRKTIICGMNSLKRQNIKTFAAIPIDDCIAWLEKQGKQKPIDMIEPKFKPGDKIVEKDIYECGSGTIKEIKDGKYIFEDNCFIYIQEQDLWQLVKEPVEPKFKIGDWVQIDGGHVMEILEVKKDVCYRILNWCGNESVRKISDIDSVAHLWTIQDAKDGDVLTTDLVHFILKSKDDMNCYMHCNYSVERNDFDTSDTAIVNSMYVHPATKEQCDLLFQKMKEAGYEWDAEKKDLKKIEQKSANPTWSEEDEKMLTSTIEYLNEFKEVYQKGAQECIKWLKSIEPNHWKPSEKQLEALWDIIPHIPNSEKNIDTITELSALYEELKNL